MANKCSVSEGEEREDSGVLAGLKRLKGKILPPFGGRKSQMKVQ